MSTTNERRTVRSTWRGGYQCEVEAGKFRLSVDEPEEVGGTDTGPMPTEMLLASVASCFTLAVAFVAKRQNVSLDSLSVAVTGHYQGPRFREIRIEARIGCDPQHVAMLIERAERVCYVTNTLRGQPDIVFSGEAVSG